MEPTIIMTQPETGTNIRVLQYWQSLADGGKLPARADMDPLDIPDLLPHLYLVEVRHDPLDFRYRLLGTAIVERSQRDYTGQSIRDLPLQAPPSLIWSLFEATVREKAPTCTLIPYRNEKTRFVEKQCLPLSSDGITVDMLMGSITFEEEQMVLPKRDAL